MATSDDPPFLNVGTEVSAKYRGAFCEATIKIAKKVVKCKISYTKGQTDTISNDLIKGPLKVGANVEVRQNDGQYLTGVIQKLTDASTYTVVFDDGDERTLRRSSLCLKGGRHYSASESLDQMPLTDPENFGTPAHFQSKRGTRRRRHLSQSTSPESDSHSPIKEPHVSKYPPEYPVGKCVFLENDRRRAGWVPGVIVPAHFVMEESEMTEDMICIRSFKDGRFFAAKTSELRDFAPDKEPLSSMLVGEIQPMYMCKPAIERAMAYLDTKELPWDMDLSVFEGNNSETRDSQNNSLTDLEESGNCEEKLSEECKQEMEDFYTRLEKFHEDKGAPFNKTPLLAGKDLDLYKLYCLVRENGGMDKVTQELKWRSLYLQMGIPQFSNSSHLIKQAYKKHLHGFEVFEKARLGGKPIKNKRRSTVQESDEDSDKQIKIAPDLTPQNTLKPKEEMNMILSSSPTNSVPLKSTPLMNDLLLSSEYKVGDRVNVLYGRGKGQRTYEAKIIEAEQILPTKIMFNVHYNGWNSRYDEWIETDRINGKATGPGGRHSGRASYSKKKHGRLKTQEQQQQNGVSGKSKMVDMDLSNSSSFNEVGSDSPGTITAPETPPSYWSGSDTGGPIKTPKSTGSNSGNSSCTSSTALAQRRRMSSATESSSNNSDNPQSPDSIPSSYILPSQQPQLLPPSASQPNHIMQTNVHPLMKQQYPFSSPLPPSITAQSVPFTTPPPLCPRVPIILSPDGPPGIPLCTPPQEDCKNVVIQDHDSSAHQLVMIRKEENLEYLEKQKEEEVEDMCGNIEVKKADSTQNGLLSPPTEPHRDVEKNNRMEEAVLYNLKHDVDPASTTPPTMETDSSATTRSQHEAVKIDGSTESVRDTPLVSLATTSDDRQQLDAAYSLMQVNSIVTTNSSFQPLSSCAGLLPTSSDTRPHPLSPPLTQSESSSIISSSSSNESEHELSMMMLESKHLSTSSSSISPDMIHHHHDDGDSPRKRKSGHDSGVENGSESDYPESKRLPREDLDFSIDMTDLNGLTTTERIGKILERMKDIQKRYMELKTEVTYLDRKRRRARKSEKETSKLLSSPNSHSSPSQTTPTLHQTPPTSSLLPLSLSVSHKPHQPQANSHPLPSQLPPLNI